jgi:Fic family protein
MMQALYEFEGFLHAPRELPPLVRLALVHYQFETIHPFMDGNGRVGRLLTALQLCELDLLPAPLLYLSAYFERNRDEYMDRLLWVSQGGAWTEWIEFFLHGVSDQSRDAIRRSERILDLWNEYQRRLQTTRASALLQKLVDHLFASPVVTVGIARRQLGVTARTAQLNIEKLVDAGIVTEVTGRLRNRVYLAREITDILVAPEA